MRRLLTPFALLAVTPFALADSPPAKHPNVLLILTDDQGWGDVRSHGNDTIDTPTLDKLAASGARFDRFFVSPVCAPTRASLLTGRYHLRTGVTWVTRGRETMRADEGTVAEALAAAGYATGCFGKWHNGAHFPHDPRGQGFGEFFGFRGGHWNNYFDTTLDHDGKPAVAKGFITDALTETARAFVRKHRERPFFCYVAYNAPHGPFQVPDRYFDKYRRRGLDEKTASVYGMVENVDDNVARLLARLDELKLADDTIVIFTTDNGPNGPRYNGGMRGTKGSVHEGGVRVPLFVRWPGRIEAKTVTQIAAHIDLYPTLLELCGVPRPKDGKPLDGVSLAPLLFGKANDWPERLLFTHQARQGEARPFPAAVRTQRYRLVLESDKPQLYDMLADPGQKNDVAAEHADVVKKLRTAYDEWFKDVTRGLERLPIPVGHAEAPLVELPAPEATLHGKMRYKGGSGWANDWITGWESSDDHADWDLDCVKAGRYEVRLLYTCPEADVGSRIRVEVGGQSVEGVVNKAHDPQPLPSPDRVPRGEVFEKVWATLLLGSVRIEPGRTKLTVRAVERAGRAVADLKAVQLARAD